MEQHGSNRVTNSNEICKCINSLILNNQSVIAELNYNIDENQDIIYNYSLKLDMYQTEVNALSVTSNSHLNFDTEKDMKASLNERIEIIENIAKCNYEKELGIEDTLKELLIQKLIWKKYSGFQISLNTSGIW